MTTERPLLERDVEYRPAVPSTLEAVYGELERFWTDVRSKTAAPVTDAWKLEMVTAITEICANIIEHAFAESPQQGTIVLKIRLYKNRVEVETTDDGAHFHEQPSDEGPTRGPDDDLPESGRGLQVARALVDTLDYRRTQESKNHWLLVKMLHGPSGGRG